MALFWAFDSMGIWVGRGLTDSLLASDYEGMLYQRVFGRACVLLEESLGASSCVCQSLCLQGAVSWSQSPQSHPASANHTRPQVLHSCEQAAQKLSYVSFSDVNVIKWRNTKTE